MKVSIQSITQALMILTDAHGKVLTDELIGFWRATLEDLTEEEFKKGFIEYSRSAKCCFWPLPGQIYNLARPEDNKEGEASLLVEVLYRVVSSCGDDREGIENAKSRLPEIVWSYIENVGGWGKFSRDMQLIDSSDTMISKSQIRKSLIALMDRKKQGKSLLVEKDTANFSKIEDLAKLIAHGVKNVPVETGNRRERNNKKTAEGSF